MNPYDAPDAPGEQPVFRARIVLSGSLALLAVQALPLTFRSVARWLGAEPSGLDVMTMLVLVAMASAWAFRFRARHAASRFETVAAFLGFAVLLVPSTIAVSWGALASGETNLLQALIGLVCWAFGSGVGVVVGRVVARQS